MQAFRYYGNPLKDSGETGCEIKGTPETGSFHLSKKERLCDAARNQETQTPEAKDG